MSSTTPATTTSRSKTSPAATVVAWADVHLRDLPWRRSRDPWEVLVAEVMLQQTQVSRVIERWVQFLDRFPDAQACAAATPAAVLREWQGLGYNRRAVMLHLASREIVERHGGHVPSELGALLALPGVGPYTARAVRAFAFEQPEAPVDTNIGRVLARFCGHRLDNREAQDLADGFLPIGDTWLYNQGVMELGASVCTKRAPRCGVCPLFDGCGWKGRGADPVAGSAGAGRPQARFAGSDRQLRGRVVDLLRAGPLAPAGLSAALACVDNGGADSDRAARVVAGLVADGLIEVDGELARLAGDRVTPAR